MWWRSSLNPVLVGGGGASIDPSPLVAGGDDLVRLRGGGPRRSSLRGAARFLRRAGSRRGMREPSLLVREAAAEQLEERQSGWAQSRPVVFLDALWNLAFVAAAGGVLVLSREETPSMPLRLWIGGYALQCVLHIICVSVQFQQRFLQRGVEERARWGRASSGRPSPTEMVEAGGYDAEHGHHEETTGLCIVFLAFDVFFIIFCVALACVIGIAVCCCLPCIIAILYAVADQGIIGQLQECCICLSAYDDGAELRELPCKHHFHRACVDKWLFINATCPLCKYNIANKITNQGGGEEV
ncbi:hypothetical protein B296_00051077 [Ensete ventricosum]|uniref:RING-type E3 ubiquitin transferase n=1 Tax=Ensete ventricosum TaxID=4639 RepID=A0A426YIE1_ENSVE|nr:hypothetical protein B296_00051077 [Ensete ventricosum]